ncbi:MAG: S1C family serine protease [Gammaproteobacteria bacterium]|nr:S1C family serine protease [Gammaproteobacteria bacterium]
MKQRYGMPPACILIRFSVLLLAAAITNVQAELSAEDVMQAVVGVESQVPADARTATILGTQRSGSGVVIGPDNLVLTIGYLVMESREVSVIDSKGTSIPAEVVAYHNESGFGLLRPEQSLNIAPLSLGDSSVLAAGDQVLVLSRANGRPVTPARVASRRAFAGSWEYLLENAIFTTPDHPVFGGAALVDPQGQLVGIGSLVVPDARTDGVPDTRGNMFVPVEELEGIFDDLVQTGRSSKPSRPWLGVYPGAFRGHLFVTRLADEGPAQQVDIQPDDIIVSVAGEPVTDMADYFRKVWAQGEAGVNIRLSILRQGKVHEVTIKSIDRYDWLKLNPSATVALL